MIAGLRQVIFHEKPVWSYHHHHHTWYDSSHEESPNSQGVHCFMNARYSCYSILRIFVFSGWFWSTFKETIEDEPLDFLPQRPRGYVQNNRDCARGRSRQKGKEKKEACYISCAGSDIITCVYTDCVAGEKRREITILIKIAGAEIALKQHPRHPPRPHRVK